MKTFKKFLVFALLGVMLTACANKKEEEPYYRTGSKQEIENYYRNKVFAPYFGENKFYATYSMAKIIKEADKEGYYTVKFLNGPYEGQTIKTKDIIRKTLPVTAEDLKRGDVVLRDFWVPRDPTKSARDRWNKAVVYDIRKIDEGRVVIELPHDSNDFIPTKETVYISALRHIEDPVTRDPRRIIP
ncbi:hypothetical protein Emin_0299 [Elusimicrobium minutum Pei191]|uniref:Lipoprotein n=1 Tax=Elusimicrobium minutum (strain Pei191) TaxID=445932 RepID=B2KBV5_ELUMP|nr:hypothetical protein [Elusimicrobium minutum]ACC97859.1 hypothetical protein Emin_0299 [Elusimicrobium minutum Pei191]